MQIYKRSSSLKNFLFITCSIFIFILGFVNKSFSQEAKLYFCEDYDNGNEINVNTKFTTGWLTVMVDLRDAGEVLGVDNVNIVIYSIEYDASNNPKLSLVNKIPFDVDPNWDYVYFKDPERLKFPNEGEFAVTCQTEEEEVIAYGVVEIEGNPLPDYIELGSNEFEKKNYKKAIQYYDTALLEDSKNPKLYALRGEAYDYKGEYEKAIADYKKSISIAPYELSYQSDLCWAYFHKKDYKEALKLFLEYERADIKNLDVRLGIAISYFKLENYDEAKTYLKNIIAFVPDFQQGMKGVTRMESLYGYTYKDSDKAIIKKMLDHFGLK